MFKPVITLTLTCAILSGCQIKPHSGIEAEQEQALVDGRVVALYTRINEICPLNDKDKDLYIRSAKRGDRLYSGSPFESYYTHAKLSVLEESRSDLARRMKNINSDLLKACDILTAEVRDIAIERQKAAEDMRQAVLGQDTEKDPRKLKAVYHGVVVQTLNHIELVCSVSGEEQAHIMNVVYKFHQMYPAGSKYYSDFIGTRLRDGTASSTISESKIASSLKQYAKTNNIESACKKAISDAVKESVSYGGIN
ncbi:hypothetical protein [Amphritea balenae]|uniref:Uncharacterized protein n=1 Tax=Amphritea balenae TaxID=452629 RepID=A0A3P1SSX4_9GAMM|nr:hypothetical protein [Amphritea balenae]RRC99282.1 hypothetical protein EHS89_10565 [Amphritea balenae]GGK72423.1 hypothetical protein GCM10007941_23070 [Amphritea balenae]